MDEKNLEDQLSRRYSELVNKKYLTGLNNQEQKELDRIDENLSKIHGTYYEKIIADLIDQFQELKKKWD